MSRQYQNDLALALEAAELADAISLKRFQAIDLKVETKPDLTPVTDADKGVEEAFRKLISEKRPEDLIIGEEFGAPTSTDGKHYWVIDPIDGTKNFVRGVPVWATLIALINENNEVVVGVASAPALGRVWFASKGNGAFVKFNGETKKISVSKVSKLSDASISYSDLLGWGDRRSKFVELQNKVWRTRSYGDFWSYVLVAEGAVDLATEPTLNLWDMAANEIIVREAGGTFTNLDGKAGPHGGNAVASNRLIHQEFLKEIQ
jgi:histidinol-phosphatase